MKSRYNAWRVWQPVWKVSKGEWGGGRGKGERNGDRRKGALTTITLLFPFHAFLPKISQTRLSWKAWDYHYHTVKVKFSILLPCKHVMYKKKKCASARVTLLLGLLFGKLTFQYGSCNFSSYTKVRPASFNGDKMICFLDRVFNALCVHWADGTEVNHLYINNTNSYNFLYWCIAKCTLFKCQCT